MLEKNRPWIRFAKPGTHAFDVSRRGDWGSLAEARPHLAIATILLSLALVFTFDLSIELGVATAIPYVISVWAAYLYRNPSWVLSTAGAAIALTLLGFLVTPDAGSVWGALANRGLAVLTIAVVAVLALGTLRTELSLAEAHAHLKRQNARLRATINALTNTEAGSERTQDGAIRGAPLFDRRVDAAVTNAERVKAYVDGMIDYARIEASCRPFQPVDLNAVVTQVEELVVDRLQPGDDITREGPLPIVLADPAQLTRLMANLVENSLTYRGDAPVSVRIRAEEEDERWLIFVEDDGVGIAREYHDELFVPFRPQAEHQSALGSGIGLALARRIVERHGGSIRIDSAEGEGCSICFDLPRSGVRRRGPARKADAGAKPRQGNRRSSGSAARLMTVLQS